MKLLFLLTVSCYSHISLSASMVKDSTRQKKDFYFFWGYNRSAYTNSNITMHGSNYHYTLRSVMATDRPGKFDPKVYFSITRFTIPQFNTRFGWKHKKHWWFSVGYDHMKYVVQKDQSVLLNGYIDSSASLKYAGSYVNHEMSLNKDFLSLEHTDGLNFASFDVDYTIDLWTSPNEKFSLEYNGGGSLGFLYPRTDATIFGKKNDNIFNLAGYGLAVKSNIRVTIFKHLFLQATGKMGWLHLPRFKTSGNTGEWGKQQIRFIESFCVLGWRFRL